MEPISLIDMLIAEENAVGMGVSRRLMMENAGKGVAEEIIKRVKPPAKVIVLAGVGNKGGDASVTARHLASAGYKVLFILLGREENIRTEEARNNYSILKKMEESVKLFNALSESDVLSFREEIINADIVIDGMLGTGIRGEPREPYATSIKLFNEAGGLKVSIDLPSGIDPDKGIQTRIFAKPDLTVTMHKVKEGILKAGKEAGRVVIVSIGIPPEAEIFAGPGDVKHVFPRRDPMSKKGDNGIVLVIGGSWLYHGAPYLTSMAALRSGIDLVFLVTPEPVANAIRGLSPNIIVLPIEGKELNINAFSSIERFIIKSDVIAIGPGLGRGDVINEAVVKIVDFAIKNNKSIVMDADALKTDAPQRVPKGAKVVLTPHAGEFKIMTGIEPPPYSKGNLRERAKTVMEVARKLNSVILLKGHYDFISDGYRLKINRSGSPAMTTGGTGDVLTGLIAGFIARGVSPFRAAVAAAYINGLAGERVTELIGYHMTASDLLEEIPKVMKKFNI